MIKIMLNEDHLLSGFLHIAENDIHQFLINLF